MPRPLARSRALAWLAPLALALPLPLALAACAPTSVTEVWRAPDWPGSFAHVAVFGVSRDLALRVEFELTMAAALAERGIAATPSTALGFGSMGELEDEAIARVLAEHEIDGVLVTRLLARRSQDAYVDGRPLAFADPSRPDLYTDLHARQAVVVAPDLSVDLDLFVIETNLYAVANSELVWSGLSEVFEAESLDEMTQGYATSMVATLLELGLVVPTQTPTTPTAKASRDTSDRAAPQPAHTAAGAHTSPRENLLCTAP